MEIIDKRTKRNNDWHVGDVICYWNKPAEKYYGLICEIKIPNDSRFGVIDLENKTESLVSFTFPLLELMIYSILSEYRYVDKVNAKLVIE